MKQRVEATAPDEEKHSVNWGGFVLWAFVILLLYVLSIGPVMALVDSKRLSSSGAFLETFYRPLEMAHRKTLLHRPLGMYLHLWSKRFDRKGDQI